MTLINFVNAHLTELGNKFIEQIYLVGISMGIATLIGIPLGVIIYRTPKTRHLITGGASILQTIPSLALFAFLLPFMGIGAKPAITALTLYALLPIIRNTASGLASIPTETIEAAKGLGFTKRQRLWMVEFPLALPIIIGGIRTATVICVGIATLATFIGAGGLGDFINQGLSLNNTPLILLGAIPAAILALLLDQIIAFIERLLSKRYSSPQKNVTLKDSPFLWQQLL